MPVVRFQWRHNTSVQWVDLNPVLLMGEPGLEEDTGNFKLGDGRRHWLDLPYSGNTGTSGGDPGALDAALAAIQAHIDSLTPHPVYDDGPSLLLLYQNAKV